MRIRISSAVAALCLAAANAHAQFIPNAGQLLQQAEPKPQPPARTQAAPIIRQDQATAPAPGGERFVLKGVKLTGNQLFSDETLRQLIRDGIGKSLDLSELEALVARITAHYRAAGYLVARAYLPAQEIDNGQVTIAILEGRIGEVIINNQATIAQSALAPARRVHAKDAIQDKALEGALLRLADTPGINVTSTLRPGATVGTSDFLIDVTPGPSLTGAVGLNNFGNRYSGSRLLDANLYWNNPLGIGDQLSLYAQSSGSNFTYGRLGYQLQFGESATRIGAAISAMDYRLGEEFASLDATGDAQVASLYLLQPLLRSRRQNLSVTLHYDDKRLTDRIGIVATKTSKAVRNLTLGLNGDALDAFGGANRFSLGYTRGELDLDTISSGLDALSARTQGRFGKWAASFERLQPLPGQFLLSLDASGQWSDKNLDSSEKLILGGANSVRAYPQGEASGDSGYLLNLELRRPLGRGVSALGFYDSGQVRINHSPWGGQLSNTRTLAGYGLGLNYDSAALSMKAFAAWKDGTGEPRSDKDRTPRIWAQIGYRF